MFRRANSALATTGAVWLPFPGAGRTGGPTARPRCRPFPGQLPQQRQLNFECFRFPAFPLSAFFTVADSGERAEQILALRRHRLHHRAAHVPGARSGAAGLQDAAEFHAEHQRCSLDGDGRARRDAAIPNKGGTGDPPVPSGDPPDGTAESALSLQRQRSTKIN